MQAILLKGAGQLKEDVVINNQILPGRVMEMCDKRCENINVNIRNKSKFFPENHFSYVWHFFPALLMFGFRILH